MVKPRWICRNAPCFRSPESIPCLAAAFLTAILLGVIVLIFRDFGFGTDEGVALRRAERTFRFLASWGENAEDVATFNVENIYGAMPDLTALVLQKLFPALSFDSRHLVAALFGLVGVVYAYKLGSRFVGPWAGFFAGLFLAACPLWFGWMFINTKDIPFAALLLVATYYGLIAVTANSPSAFVWIKAGLATGFLATTKLVGVVILGFVLVVFLASLLLVPREDALQPNRKLVMRVTLLGASGLLGSLLSFAIFWPQFYFYSFDQLSETVESFINAGSRGKWQDKPVLLHGVTYEASEVPWYYTIWYFLIGTPLFFSAFLVVGAGLGLWRRQPAIVGATLVSVATLGGQVLIGAGVYGGFRHFLFLLPFMAIIAAYPVALALAMAERALLRATVASMAIVGVVWSVYQMVRLHPYEYSYYNALVGGIRGADKLYDIDIWRSAYRAALTQLKQKRGSKGNVAIYSCGSPLNLQIVPGFRGAKKPENAKYVISLRRGCPPEMFEKFGWPVVGEIYQSDVLLTRVYRVRR